MPPITPTIARSTLAITGDAEEQMVKQIGGYASRVDKSRIYPRDHIIASGWLYFCSSLLVNYSDNQAVVEEC
jgi:hypothetical protein